MPLKWVAPTWLALTVCLPAVACVTEDTGKVCGNANAVVPNQPVAGEDTVVELVNLYRDPSCETFQCLQHRGLQSYCTRSCVYNAVPKAAKTCTTDDDCRSPLHCNAGVCNDDDCPAGFWCRTVQEVGPLAGQQFCTRHDNCKNNFDCDDAAHMVCTKVGCFDSCLKDPTTCQFHALTCERESDLGCHCTTESTTTCADPELICKPQDAKQTFPAGSVRQLGICLPK